MIMWRLQEKAGAVFLAIDIIQHIDIIQLVEYYIKKISTGRMSYAIY